MKFRKKPVVIEARQYTGKNGWDLIQWVRTERVIPQDIGEGQASFDNPKGEKHLTLDVVGGGHEYVRKDDWIIQGVTGEFYPCKTGIFEKTFDPVEESTEK